MSCKVIVIITDVNPENFMFSEVTMDFDDNTRRKFSGATAATGALSNSDEKVISGGM